MIYIFFTSMYKKEISLYILQNSPPYSGHFIADTCKFENLDFLDGTRSYGSKHFSRTRNCQCKKKRLLNL